MECKGIKEKLGAYLEGVLSPEEMRIIEEHLPSCPECRRNLADLKKTGELVKDLSEVEPPAWFTQKIMSRIRAEEEKKKGILQKLFYPLHVKIPIQALATGFIAVIAVFVFRAVEPEMKFTHLPSPAQPTTQQVMPKEERKEPSPLAERITVKSPAPPPKSAPKDEAAPEPAGASAVPSAAALPKPAPEPFRAEKKQEAEESLGKGEGIALPRVEKLHPPMGAAPETQERKKLAAARGFKEDVVSKSKPANVVVKTADLHLAGGKLDELLRQLGAQKIEKESSEGREVLTAELDARQVKGFFEKLKAIGEVDKQDIPREAPSGHVVVRVEIVSAP